MKKYLLAAIAGLTCTFAAIPAALGQSAVFSFNDGNGAPNSGSYNGNTSFTLAISLAFTPGGSISNLAGLSYWFEQQSPGAPFSFSITNRDLSGSLFSDPQNASLAYPQSMNPQNADDLGASLPGTPGVGAGNYFIANLTIYINPDAPSGNYFIGNTINGKASVVSDDQGRTFAIPRTLYAIRVPEGGNTAGLLGVSVLGLVGLSRRRQRA
jgi:hypothetical protein